MSGPYLELWDAASLHSLCDSFPTKHARTRRKTVCHHFHTHTHVNKFFLSAKHEQGSDVKHFCARAHSKLDHVFPLLFPFSNYSIQDTRPPPPHTAVFQSHSAGPNTSCSKIVWVKSRFTGQKQHRASLSTSFTIPLSLPILSPPLCPLHQYPIRYWTQFSVACIHLHFSNIFFDSLSVLLFTIHSLCSLSSWLSRQAYDSHSRNLFIELQTKFGQSNIVILFSRSSRQISASQKRQSSTRIPPLRNRSLNKTGNVTYKVTLRRVRESLLPWKKAVSITYWSVVCVRACMWVPGCVGVCIRIRARSLANPARNAYAPYCDVICGPLGLHYIFRHYLTNGAIFGKKVIEHKMRVLICSITFL
jgi:hypothetical protein